MNDDIEIEPLTGWSQREIDLEAEVNRLQGIIDDEGYLRQELKAEAERLRAALEQRFQWHKQALAEATRLRAQNLRLEDENNRLAAGRDAEVERLRKENKTLRFTDATTKDGLQGQLFEASLVIERLRAEVERLRGALEKAQEHLWHSYCDAGCSRPADDKEIKAAIAKAKGEE